MKYRVIIKSLRAQDEIIVLADNLATLSNAEWMRRSWRRVLGNKHWHIDRRPGVDTLDHLALKIEVIK
jgi:hypothetical protein